MPVQLDFLALREEFFANPLGKEAKDRARQLLGRGTVKFQNEEGLLFAAVFKGIFLTSLRLRNAIERELIKKASKERLYSLSTGFLELLVAEIKKEALRKAVLLDVGVTRIQNPLVLGFRIFGIEENKVSVMISLPLKGNPVHQNLILGQVIEVLKIRKNVKAYGPALITDLFLQGGDSPIQIATGIVHSTNGQVKRFITKKEAEE